MRKLKNIIALFIAVFVSINLLAYDFAVDGIYYNVTSSTTVEVAGCNGTNIVIPKTVTFAGKDYTVVGIGNSAFKNKNLTSVEMPNSITTIGNSAFYGCNKLTSIEIPNSVTSIGSDAFYNCNNLGSINVAEDNPNYSTLNGILYNKSKTNIIQVPKGISGSVNLPNSLISIAYYAFKDCTKITNIDIPNGVTSIGSNAFSGCNKLTSIEIPNSVTSIGSNAFSGCNKLTSIEIPNSVTSIGSSAFSGCNKLTSIEIPNSVKSIESSAFHNCTGLISIELPNSIIKIGSSAFGGCSSLTNIDIHDSIKYIEDYAFYNCTELTSIGLPNSIKFIGDYAFYNCTGLININIPDSVNVGSHCFEKCSDLVTIYIGKGVNIKVIDTSYSSIFWGCSSVQYIYVKDNIPPIIDDYTFYNVSKWCAVYVPCGSVDTYKNADGWKEFQNIQAEGECNEDTTITTPTDPIITDTTINMSVNICAGESYEFYDTILTQSGSYTYTINNSIYGDTIINLDLTVYPTYNKDTLVVAKYTNGAYPLYTEGLTETYNQDGLLIGFTKEDTLQSIYGCDSIIVLMLEIEYSTQNDTLSISICEGETYSFNGQELTESGIYTDTLTSVAGTDSIVTLILKVYQNITKYVTAVICENSSYSFNGDNYSQAGVYTANPKTEKGCDSTVILTLNTLPTYDTTIKATICSNETYTLANQEFNKAGIYQIKLPTVNCCDSNITLILTVLPEITNDIEVSICSGHSYSFAGEELTESGIYYDTIQNEDGCDSVAILHLSVNTAYDTTIVVEIAPDEVYIFNGDTLSTSGTYTAHYYTETNCDSIVTVQLYVKSSLSEIETANSVIIYPNPAKDKVTIEGEGDIIVTNNFGQIVYKTNSPYKTNGTNKPLTMIDVSNWESGIYYVKVSDKTKKLIIE